MNTFVLLNNLGGSLCFDPSSYIFLMETWEGLFFFTATGNSVRARPTACFAKNIQNKTVLATLRKDKAENIEQ